MSGNRFLQERIEMNSLELERYGRAAAIETKTRFLGVFPADKIPQSEELRELATPFAYVVNTDPASRPGEHWLAVYHDNNGNIDFFDSYGCNFDVYSNLRFDSTMNPNRFNSISLQALDSAVCGHYCLYFIYKRSRYMSMSLIASNLAKTFNNNRARIDNFVVKFVCRTVSLCAARNTGRFSCRCPSVVQCCGVWKQRL